jgi:hypothetical protein
MSSDMLPYLSSAVMISMLLGEQDEATKYCEMAAKIGSTEAKMQIFHNKFISVFQNQVLLENKEFPYLMNACAFEGKCKH